MLETHKNDQHVRNEHRHEWRNKTRRESSAAKRSTYRRNTHHRSRATGRHCIHAMTARVRKRCAPTRGRTHTPPTGGIQAVNGEREATQQPPPNKQHSHAHHDLSRREQPNPAHPHPRKTHERHLAHDIPSGKHPPHSTNHAPPVSGRGHEKRAHPEMWGARDADETNNITPTLTRATTQIPTTRRNMSHKRQRARPLKKIRQARPQMRHPHLVGYDKSTIAHEPDKHHRYATRGFTLLREQPRRQTRR